MNCSALISVICILGLAGGHRGITYQDGFEFQVKDIKEIIAGNDDKTKALFMDAYNKLIKAKLSEEERTQRIAVFKSQIKDGLKPTECFVLAEASNGKGAEVRYRKKVEEDEVKLGITPLMPSNVEKAIYIFTTYRNGRRTGVEEKKCIEALNKVDIDEQ